jgi:Ser/Thr protein kinase RdoA (MazF antagonist)
MSKRGTHFSSEELARVLSHYNIGVIYKIEPLPGGGKRAPKLVITSEQGKFLLKRRLRVKDDLLRVSFAHAVLSHLCAKAFPVAPLIATADGNSTVLQLNNHIYEFFGFVSGSRYDGSAEATVEAGRQLAKFHQYLADFTCEWEPVKSSFHDSATVRKHLKTIGTGRDAEPDKKLREIADVLTRLYNSSSVSVNELGFDSWKQQVVHGDWHPGNMLFSKRKLIALVDFDSVKLAPPVTDLANGMLQFSIVGDRPNPADWPDYLDQAKLVQFLNGYREIIELDENKLGSLVSLMIETIIAEAVLPVAATGFFGNLGGLDFLKMIRRKAEWMNKNRTKLTEAIQG